MSLAIYTIGHSTHFSGRVSRAAEAHAIGAVADIRTIPNRDGILTSAERRWRSGSVESGIGYRHFPALGGLRRPRPDSINTAIRHPSFRGYADHMQTPEFARRGGPGDLRGRAADDGDVR